jgi:hypothetical protein
MPRGLPSPLIFSGAYLATEIPTAPPAISLPFKKEEYIVVSPSTPIALSSQKYLQPFGYLLGIFCLADLLGVISLKRSHEETSF